MSIASRTPTTPEEYQQYRSRFHNWGRWGDDDELGTLNHITAETRRGAAALVRDGYSVSCALPLATSAVVPDEQRNPRPADHRVDEVTIGCVDYVGVAYHGFVNTHVDALCHIYTLEGDEMYNGRSVSLVAEGGVPTNSVEHWRDGIVTRGVLFDMPRMRGTDYVEPGRPVEGWDLEDYAAAHGIEPRAGDAVLIRSGRQAFWAANPDFAVTMPPSTPGVAASVLEYLYEHDAALLGWDLQEAGGQELSRLPIHQVALPHMGLPLLDNADFDRLAEACAERERYEFLLTIAPLVVIGGTGSPVNPIATF